MTRQLQLVEVEVLPGLELSLYPWENANEIGSQLEAFFDEVERRPELGDELNEDELWELLGEEAVNDASFDGESFVGRPHSHC